MSLHVFYGLIVSHANAAVTVSFCLSPAVTVVAADFADSECEASAKSGVVP